ncbi:MAG: cytochrome c3 family protein [Candidatus Kapaibacterium sp.]
MKKIYFIIVPLILVACLLLGENPRLQTKQKLEIKVMQEVKKSMKTTNNLAEEINKNITCKTCHADHYPTTKDPQLSPCPREGMISASERSYKEGPDGIILEALSDKYEGVLFSHRIHSQMAEMTTGCSGCHHYNTSGPILKCNKCHEQERAREDVSVPDLKSAYHRMCTTCHKQWSRQNGCNTQCHKPKGKGEPVNLQQLLDAIKGKNHPLVPQPESMKYETSHEEGKFVTFYHNEHFDLFNIECKSCHGQDNCISCHPLKGENKINPVKEVLSFEEKHMKCSSCHGGHTCNKCHKTSEASPFNHAKSTGWALSSYHNKLDCESCHGRGQIKSLSRECKSCHDNFKLGSFNHKVTGIVLSEAHVEIECKTCHPNENFTAKPECKECHDDMSYPQFSPVPKKR